MFSSKCFIVVSLKLSPMIHFELVFLYGIRKGSCVVLLNENIEFQQPFVEKTVLALRSYLDTFVEILLALSVKVYFWAINSVSWICIFILMTVLCLDYFSFVVSSPTFFFFRIVLAVTSSLYFHMDFMVGLENVYF